MEHMGSCHRTWAETNTGRVRLL